MGAPIGSLVLQRRQTNPRRPTAAGIFDCSRVVDGILLWIKVWILPDLTQGHKPVALGDTTKWIHCGAVVSISGYFDNGLMERSIFSDPPFDDLNPLKQMSGCAVRAKVGTGRDNKSWSRIGFGFGILERRP